MRSLRKMKRKQQTQEELRKASNHLHYEIWMFTSLARGMASGITGKGVIHNALLESFTIHARVLLDFLYAKKPQPDDVIADDFFPTSQEWKEVRPKKTEVLEKVHKRVGKEVAHLTYARQDVTPEMKPWSYLQILHDIEVSFNEFLRIVPMEFLGERWENEKERIRKMRKDT